MADLEPGIELDADLEADPEAADVDEDALVELLPPAGSGPVPECEAYDFDLDASTEEDFDLGLVDDLPSSNGLPRTLLFTNCFSSTEK